MRVSYCYWRNGEYLLQNLKYENHDIAIAMSSSLADPVLGLNILQG